MDLGMSRGEGIWLDLPAVLGLTSGPPRRLYVFNPDNGDMELVGGAGRGSSLLVMPGDPPDFVTIDGDVISVEEL
jgi:hypothetical protein